MNESTKSTSRPRRIVRWLLRLTVRLLAVFGLLTAIYLACFRYSRMTSPSMSPTLQGDNWEDGDRVLTEKVSFWFRQPRRWEVITVRSRDGMVVMKRVVGLPGEAVQMLRHGEILIDGRQIAAGFAGGTSVSALRQPVPRQAAGRVWRGILRARRRLGRFARQSL